MNVQDLVDQFTTDIHPDITVTPKQDGNILNVIITCPYPTIKASKLSLVGETSKFVKSHGWINPSVADGMKGSRSNLKITYVHERVDQPIPLPEFQSVTGDQSIPDVTKPSKHEENLVKHMLNDVIDDTVVINEEGSDVRRKKEWEQRRQGWFNCGPTKIIGMIAFIVLITGVGIGYLMLKGSNLGVSFMTSTPTAPTVPSQ